MIDMAAGDHIVWLKDRRYVYELNRIIQVEESRNEFKVSMSYYHNLDYTGCSATYIEDITSKEKETQDSWLAISEYCRVGNLPKEAEVGDVIRHKKEGNYLYRVTRAEKYNKYIDIEYYSTLDGAGARPFKSNITEPSVSRMSNAAREYYELVEDYEIDHYGQSFEDEIVEYARINKVGAVRIYRDKFKLGLKEGKDAVEMLVAATDVEETNRLQTEAPFAVGDTVCNSNGDKFMVEKMIFDNYRWFFNAINSEPHVAGKLTITALSKAEASNYTKVTLITNLWD